MDNIINQLYQYQRDKQNVEHSLKNGRVDISGKYNKKDMIPLFNEDMRILKETNTELLSHTYDETLEQKYFFSRQNINNLQNLIKYHVYHQSGKKHIISNQDVDQLLIIMKSIYLQHSSNYNPDLVKQVKRLNAFVIDYAVPNILSNIEMNRQYKKDVTRLPKPIELPKYISSAGTRTNPNFIY